MSLGETLEEQCLSRASRLVEISSSLAHAPEHDKGWAHLPAHIPTSLFGGQTPFPLAAFQVAGWSQCFQGASGRRQAWGLRPKITNNR